jgi:hypothetical protein
MFDRFDWFGGAYASNWLDGAGLPLCLTVGVLGGLSLSGLSVGPDSTPRFEH